MDLDLAGGTDSSGASGGEAYRVLARKYRPHDFKTLYGQEALVRTLSNAITSGRLAHAFMLTGVRGVGKTTTARIIAKALNCTGAAGDLTGPTPEPCGVCDNCTAILKDHHPDVMEMDAASHTGVDDIRELQKSVAFRPAMGRYKIFIIDEVHMLSNNAFNALLKTLEEPPEQVIFIFATTEIRKVPVTVLSRCQRFDLRRIGPDVLIDLFTHVVGQEGLEAEAEALSLIARAADGSARDGLSILDQAIALSGSPVTAAAVTDMLGLADRAAVLDLFDHLMAGRIPETLALFSQLYQAGAQPITLITDLTELTHWITRAKVGAASEDRGTPQAQRDMGFKLAERLSLAHLSRAWQMLSKGLNEIKGADNSLEAAEMVLIRLAYAAELPTPDDILKKLEGAPETSAAGAPNPAPNSSTPNAATLVSEPSMQNVSALSPRPMEQGPAFQDSSQAASDDSPLPAPVSYDRVHAPQAGSSGVVPNIRALHPQAGVAATPRKISSLADIIQAAEDEPDQMLLAAELRAFGRVVKLREGHLEIARHPKFAKGFSNTLSRLLMNWTGERWLVTLSEEDGGSTLAEDQFSEQQSAKAEDRAHPLVQRVLTTFPGAEIINQGSRSDPD